MRPFYTQQRSRKNSAGFTLVEIVIALGIVSFAVVALVGLMAVSMTSGRDAAVDTAIASMARQVSVELRAKKFDTLKDLKKSIDSNDLNYFFDADAHPLSSPAGDLLVKMDSLDDKQGQPFYRCRPTIVEDVNYTWTYNSIASIPNLYNVKLEFFSTLKKNDASNKPLITICNSLARYE